MPIPSVPEYNSETMGPSHAIVCRLTSGGHGAAACTRHCRLDRSYPVRVSAGSFSSRTSMVGTTWVCVTLCRSICRRNSSASNRSITTTVAPSAWAPADHCSPAEWYSGAGTRYVDASDMPISDRAKCPTPMARGSSNASPVSGRRIPLGRPVVPDE